MSSLGEIQMLMVTNDKKYYLATCTSQMRCTKSCEKQGFCSVSKLLNKTAPTFQFSYLLPVLLYK